VAGVVEAVGGRVTGFQPGDEVFGCTSAHGYGAFAEYVSLADDVLVRKPPNVSFEHAAAVPLAAMTALKGLRDHGRLEQGQEVLIVGASGGVGTFAVQIAKSLGAEVTGVCSTRNLDLVGSIGADRVIDYTREDFTRGGRRYDLILQVAGTVPPSRCRRALTPKGTLVLISGDSRGHLLGPVARLLRALAMSPFVSQRMVAFTMKPNGEDMELLRGLLEAGGLTPVIDRTYPLTEVPEAIRYLEQGHARGKVVVTV
jgi:NADPH:quinone reductase-like Zn-dependent oxidoreductase